MIAAWDFSQEMSSSRIVDRSPNALHGTAINLPARGMTGANWTGDITQFPYAPDQYGAIHFHDDDLDDAKWETDFTFTIPASLPSGVYAARLRAGDDVDHIPFVVRPAPGSSTAPIAYLISTFTYLAYANEHMAVEPASLFPFRRFLRPRHWSTSTSRTMASIASTTRTAMAPASATRPGSAPWSTLRPQAVFRIYGAPERLGGDLYLTHWLEQKGLAFDTIADEHVHEDGVDLLSQYKVIVTGCHPEYWTRPMLDALDAYLDNGGRVMYLGGNGFYWVTGVDPERPHVIEIRRWRGTETWEAEPGETWLSTTG